MSQCVWFDFFPGENSTYLYTFIFMVLGINPRPSCMLAKV